MEPDAARWREWAIAKVKERQEKRESVQPLIERPNPISVPVRPVGLLSVNLAAMHDQYGVLAEREDENEVAMLLEHL